jgi:hypothetical protein
LDKASNAIKIGKADDMSVRLSDLQIGNPNILEVIGYLEFTTANQAFQKERTLHNRFRNIWIRGEWFTYDSELFNDNFFQNEMKIKRKAKREPLIRHTLFGIETILDESTHPFCYFYPWLRAQVLDSYENCENKTIPYRTMSWDTNGKCMIPGSSMVNRVLISDRKHKENLLEKRFENNKIIENRLKEINHDLNDFL